MHPVVTLTESCTRPCGVSDCIIIARWYIICRQSVYSVYSLKWLVCLQLPVSDIKKIPGPITPEGPKEIPGEKSLTQELKSGPLVNEKAETRGLK